jgi:glycosyltransferase involved in cell wall biosynthesis
LDYIWAGIPFIITEGDAWADLTKKEKIGYTVAPGDVEGLAIAIENIITDDETTNFAGSFDKLRQAHRWDKVILPLTKFCSDPYIAPDKNQYLTEAERIRRDKDAFLQQVIQDKDAYLEEVIQEREVLRDSLMRYHHLPPVRAYHWLKRKINIR